MTQDPLVLRQDTAGVSILTLNAPRSINALSEDMLDALSAALDAIKADTTVKAVVIRSAGAHFCAGHNLKEMTARRSDPDGGHQYFNDLFAKCAAMMLRIVHLPQPVIAEVKGIATAAGCQLVATCDLAVAAEDATFATSGVNIGLFCSTPMVALSRNVPRKMAMEMLLLGDFLPAQQVPRPRRRRRPCCRHCEKLISDICAPPPPAALISVARTRKRAPSRRHSTDCAISRPVAGSLARSANAAAPPRCTPETGTVPGPSGLDHVPVIFSDPRCAVSTPCICSCRPGTAHRPCTRKLRSGSE